MKTEEIIEKAFENAALAENCRDEDGPAVYDFLERVPKEIIFKTLAAALDGMGYAIRLKNPVDVLEPILRDIAKEAGMDVDEQSIKKARSICEERVEEPQMTMKHWRKEQTEDMHSPGINLLDGAMDRTLSIGKDENGLFELREGCDGYFCKRCTKAEAMEALQEAIDWLNTQ